MVKAGELESEFKSQEFLQIGKHLHLEIHTASAFSTENWLHRFPSFLQISQKCNSARLPNNSILSEKQSQSGNVPVVEAFD